MENEKCVPNLQYLQEYVLTIQTCQKCGLCFQNRQKKYKGKHPFCKRCRPKDKNRELVYLVDVYNINNNVSINCTQFVIPVNNCPPSVIDTLRTINNSKKTNYSILLNELTPFKTTFNIGHHRVKEYFMLHN